MFEHAVEDLRSRRFDTVTLWVLETNRRARRFYEVAGWKHDGTVAGERRLRDAADGSVPHRAVDLGIGLQTDPRTRAVSRCSSVWRVVSSSSTPASEQLGEEEALTEILAQREQLLQLVGPARCPSATGRSGPASSIDGGRQRGFLAAFVDAVDEGLVHLQDVDGKRRM